MNFATARISVHNEGVGRPLLNTAGQNYNTLHPPTLPARNVPNNAVAGNGPNDAAFQHQHDHQTESSSDHDVPPLQAPNDEANGEVVPSARKDLACKKKLYLAHSEDSKQWVSDTLIPSLETVEVEVVTIRDAIPGKTKLSARTDFIKEACKIILVISKQSKEDKTFLHDISKARHKDPDPTKITIIPILFGNVTHNDVPKSITDLIPIHHDDEEFQKKIKQSIDS